MNPDKEWKASLDKLSETKRRAIRLKRITALGAEDRQCYTNVRMATEQYGGKGVVGWEVVEYPDMVEFRHHAVWENPKGELCEITPNTSGVFIPDPSLPPFQSVSQKTVDDPSLQRTSPFHKPSIAKDKRYLRAVKVFNKAQEKQMRGECSGQEWARACWQTDKLLAKAGSRYAQKKF